MRWLEGARRRQQEREYAVAGMRSPREVPDGLPTYLLVVFDRAETETTERGVRATSLVGTGLGSCGCSGKSWAPGAPRLARSVWHGLYCGPLAGPDAKTPAFPSTFFSRTRSFARARRDARRRRERRGMESEAPPIYECALAALLAEGVAEDVRPLLKKWIESPSAFVEA